MKLPRCGFAIVLLVGLTALEPGVFAYQDDLSTLQPSSLSQAAAPEALQNAGQLQQLVAPIALYPDALLAQCLAAATYPAEVVEAERWMQQNAGLQGQDLVQQVNEQHWDDSIKALTQFPDVLANMDKNLAWTSALGDAYVNQQQDVMNAVQTLRQRAQQAGNLSSTSQETVTNQGPTIEIQPADPDVLYVPEYNPWLAYGDPLDTWPGWYPYPGLYFGGPGTGFGLGFPIGLFGRYGWGWHHWGADWRGRGVIFNHNPYSSHSPTFVNRNNFHPGRGNFGRPGDNRPPGRPNSGGRGASLPHAPSGMHSGAFSGFDHGGVARGLSSRGQSSFGTRGASPGGGLRGGGDGGSRGGGGFHGGGGGGHR